MLTTISSQLADIVDAAAPSVVQVRAGGRAASGVAFDKNLILTTGRVVGRDEQPEVRTAAGSTATAEIAGWDPATRLVLLKAPGLDISPFTAGDLPRVGSLAIAIGRSISNNVTATAGLVSIIGGPLRTGHRRQIDQVIRISAPVHGGFAGGAVMGADGSLLGVATAASIRGLPVVIPASIAWASGRNMLERGQIKRGYLGIAAQPVRVPERQRAATAGEEVLLVVGIKNDSPAASAGLLLGDVLLSLDDVALSTPDDLIDLLAGDRVGRALTLRVLRGGKPIDVSVTPAER